MKKVIALVGRPNVGKSTLFNCLTRSRDALVADQPGMTRDRKYGEAHVGFHRFIVIDTGGLSGEEEQLDTMMAQQVWQAVAEADHVLMLADARDGLLADDHAIVQRLRRSKKPVTLVVNKIDGVNSDMVLADFYSLGLGEPQAISASNSRGIATLIDHVFADEAETEDTEQEQYQGIKIAVVGRPNVGKSTLVNRILGEERVLACDLPGTTRDSIYIPFNRSEQDYVLIDTAGVRRRGRIDNKLEKFSVIKTLQAIDEANVVIMVLDAQQNISDQDAHLIGYAIDAGRAMVIAVNKWDGLESEQREWVKTELHRKLQFCEFAQVVFISALHGTGVGNLFAPIQRAYESATRDIPTPLLTRILEQAVEDHPPPTVKGRRIKLRYAHQGGRNPPTIVIHGNQTDRLNNTYKRYLINLFVKTLKLQGTPVRLELVTGDNPYKDRKNTLTRRQIEKKKRQRKHTQKRKNK